MEQPVLWDSWAPVQAMSVTIEKKVVISVDVSACVGRTELLLAHNVTYVRLRNEKKKKVPSVLLSEPL